MLAKKYDIPLPDAERIRDEFIKFDIDGSGEIDFAEFREMVPRLIGGKNAEPPEVADACLHDWWRTINSDASETIDFEEFLTWYYHEFDGGKFFTSWNTIQNMFYDNILLESSVRTRTHHKHKSDIILRPSIKEFSVIDFSQTFFGAKIKICLQYGLFCIR